MACLRERERESWSVGFECWIDGVVCWGVVSYWYLMMMHLGQGR